MTNSNENNSLDRVNLTSGRDQLADSTIGWSWFVFPVACALIAGADRAVRIQQGVPWQMSWQQGLSIAGLVAWLFYFGFRLRNVKWRIQFGHFSQACEELGLQVAESEQLSNIVPKQHSKLGLLKPGVQVLGFAEGETLTLAWIETSTYTHSVHSGSHDRIDATLVGLIHNTSALDGQSRASTEYMQSGAGVEPRNGSVFRVKSCQRSRYNELPILKRWLERMMDSVDWTCEEIVAAVNEKQSRVNGKE